MMRPAIFLILSVIILPDRSTAFPQFQDAVPNGNRVPHPCLDNYLWSGLGHKLSEGSGERNPFGHDFDRNGRKWDRCLCERDSDGDGKTNGEELGDPECVWQPGDVPHRVDELTHPGVCEPLNSTHCLTVNDWEFCTTKELVCDAIHDPEVQEIRLQYPRTKVPATETNYYCMTFDLPTDQSYHLIADRPILDNTIVEHHMLVFGCTEPEDGSALPSIEEPALCDMGVASCPDMIAIWSVGFAGSCLPDTYGFRVGMGGISRVIVQIHWNNPEMRDDYWDSPGMSLFLTPILRPNDGGILQVGTSDIEIPGRSSSYQVNGYCRPACTKDLPHHVNIERVILHMHYLGVESGFSHTSGDGGLQQLVYEEHYSYDLPKVYTFQQPLQFHPGDTLGVSCTYQSQAKANTTYYGDGTSDEMCYAFVTYYPKVPRWSFCETHGDYDICPVVLDDGCDSDTFFTLEHLAGIYTTVNDVCNKTGASPEACPEGCAEAVSQIRADNPCLQGQAGMYIEQEVLPQYFGEYGINLVSLLHTCDARWKKKDDENVDDNPNDTKDEVPQNTTMTSLMPSGPCVFDSDSPTDPPVGEAVRHGLALWAMVITLVTFTV